MTLLMRITLASVLALLGFGCASQNKSGNSAKEMVNAAELKPNTIQHDQLSEEQLNRIKRLQETFAEVDKSSLETWIDNFKRDADPDSELAVWERVARAYKSNCDGKDLTLEAKADIFKVLVMRSMTSKEEAIDGLKLKVLSKDEARKVMSTY